MDRTGRHERLAMYALDSPAADRANAIGLANAEWFHSAVPRKRMKELMRRDDMPALRWTALWLGVMLVSAGLAVATWGAWYAIVFLLVYGILYGSGGDSRWHETGHGTPFETRWMNAVVYHIASFMMMREPTVWRWNHTRHHTDTIIVGMDPEIQAMRPARLARIIVNFAGLYDVPMSFKLMFMHAFGRLTRDEEIAVPSQEQHKVYRTARIWLLIYAAAIATSIFTWSILPLLLIGGPRIYATFMHTIYALTQHAGLQENALDHRLNCRTIKMCWVNRFIYWNMNYHVEHHMFPMVPSHKLPDLHADIKHDLPTMYPSIWAAYKEIIPAVLRQLKDPTYGVRRELPPGAAPYYEPIQTPAP